MRRLIALLAALPILLLPVLAAAEGTIAIGALLSGAPAFDGRSVTIEGEALGDVMRRGDFGWVNIGDGTGAIGVWAPVSALEAIKSTGVYGHIGDRVRVTGTFFRAAANLGGDTALQAETLEVIAPGADQPRPTSGWRVLIGLAAAALAGALVITWQRRRRAPA